MEWSKIKNIVLLILLIVNGFLLWQVADQEWRTARYREEARRDAVRFLADASITVDPDLLPEERRLRPMAAERDRESEQSMAQILLGSAEETGKSGTYTGERGTATFLSNGSYSVTFSPGAWPMERESLEKETLRLLRQAGLEYTVTSSEEQGGAVRLTLRQFWSGTPLFNCQTVAIWENGQLTALEGQQRLIGTPAITDRQEAINVPTVLLRFLSGVRTGGYVCNEIRSLAVGYETTVSPNGTAKLSPVWQVVTDGGVFYLDGITGVLRQAERG